MKPLPEFYQSNIVLLSIIIGVFGSFVSISLNDRITSSNKKKKNVWMFLASLSMGLTIWSVHFIGMLAFSLPVYVEYEIGLVLLAVLPAAGASGIALYTLHNRKIKPKTMLSAGFLIGLSIVAMHCLGMSAMKMNASISYRPSLILLSVVTATLISYASLYILYVLNKKKETFYRFIASILLGLGIASVHYIGMKAANFSMMGHFPSSGQLFEQPLSLILLILFVVGLLFIFFLTVAIFDQQTATRLAYYDDLTDLPNRRKLQVTVDSYLRERKKPLLLIMMDIDNFMWINETFGFMNGNLLMRALSQRLEQLIPPNGLLSRAEGNKFTILLMETYTEKEAFELTRSWLKKLAAPFVISNYPVTVTASAGISLAPAHGYTFEQLNAAAEKALYFAKTNGKNQLVVYNPAVHDNEKERQIAMSFREALQNNEFYLCYQPKYNVKEKRISCAEVLVRWNSPEFGFVPPSIFIPIAEKNGFITELTEWTLNEACRQMKEWRNKSHPLEKIAVNISAPMFLSHALHQTVTGILRKYRLDGRHLELEITETSIMENLDTAVKVIKRLQADHISIALDDFGTGVSSLTYLKKLPIHSLKIDKSFIDDVHTSPEGKALVEMIIHLAKLFHLHVVAEGVETEEQLQTLISLKCDEIQGYHISKPLQAHELDEFFKAFTAV
ncbi:EAL domain-containing protein [Bacillus badius]|uniref:bifunctional diguanylate cyclase/phosphodiesterase n=1 Tax=Bacillus badius TaxID=1455 RepID=UPI00059770A7|nr:EAL domain-containing protein [Bacillus badius]KIL72219.1 phosphodiesterase [Bacillus badius]